MNTTVTNIHFHILGPGFTCQRHGCELEARECLDVTYSDGWEEGHYLCPSHADALVLRHGGQPALDKANAL